MFSAARWLHYVYRAGLLAVELIELIAVLLLGCLKLSQRTDVALLFLAWTLVVIITLIILTRAHAVNANNEHKCSFTVN